MHDAVVAPEKGLESKILSFRMLQACKASGVVCSHKARPGLVHSSAHADDATVKLNERRSHLEERWIRWQCNSARSEESYEGIAEPVKGMAEPSEGTAEHRSTEWVQQKKTSVRATAQSLNPQWQRMCVHQRIPHPCTPTPTSTHTPTNTLWVCLCLCAKSAQTEAHPWQLWTAFPSIRAGSPPNVVFCFTRVCLFCPGRSKIIPQTPTSDGGQIMHDRL